ncbi:RDD family protein [Candidatus Woesearchaeota archaeon]|nr:RDD family protein [Candidatus Woesearchaeota archaeon]
MMKRLNLPKERTFIGPALIWKRVAAFFIDITVINLVVFFPFRKLFRGIMPQDYSFAEAYGILSSTSYSGFLTSVSLVMSVLVIMYFYMMERKMAQTIGKMIMKVYVAGDNSGNNGPKAWQLLARNAVFIPMFPFILLWILDPLFMFFTKTNQRLSEILGKTRVVETYSLEQ